MKPIELKKNLFWTGVKDKDLKVFDIIMETEFGTTYNSYILKGSEKTALVETAKFKFYENYLVDLKQLIDPHEIDYVIVNHTEPDHAGSVEFLLQINPNLKIIGSVAALGFLKNIVNRDFYSITAKDGDQISLGDKTLHFINVPNLHWPDSMYTYVAEDQVLFTCDSFGSHYSFDGILLSEVTDSEGYHRALKYYYDNIIGPFKPYMLKALEKIKDLPIQVICTGHGPILDCRIPEILETYSQWSTVVNPNSRKTVIIPYVSAYGYTQKLAVEIEKGIKESGDVDVRSYDMVTASPQAVLEELSFADGILFGTPTIVGDALKPIWDLTTSMFAAVHGGKLAGAFGSYGWSGEGVPHIMERLKQLRMKTIDDGFRIKFKPSENELIDAYDYGFNFGCVLQNKENPKTKTSGRKLVKCLVCGEIFDESLEICPVCSVGKENFVPVEAEEVTFRKDTQEIFLILGNGAAGINAATAIRERNKTCSIVMVSNEAFLSYNRPMLTKNMLASFDPSQLAIHEESWYTEHNILNLLDKTVISIDTSQQEAILSDGVHLKYHKLIYALGAECFIPPIKGHETSGVVAIRRLSDTMKISSMLKDVKEAVVIGGGVLGLEAAWELKKNQCKVTILEAAPLLMGRQLDENASDLLKAVIASKNIRIETAVQIEKIMGNEAVSGVRLSTGEIIDAQLVIVSAGVRANTSIASAAGIEVEKAVVVSSTMETNVPHIYACGDCAQFEGISYAVWPQAIEMGKTAGANAAGDTLEYKTLTPALTFNGMGTTLFSLGDAGKKSDLKYKTVEIKDIQRFTYEKYYFVNNRLQGVILIGDTSKMAVLTQYVEKNAAFKEIFAD